MIFRHGYQVSIKPTSVPHALVPWSHRKRPQRQLRHQRRKSSYIMQPKRPRPHLAAAAAQASTLQLITCIIRRLVMFLLHRLQFQTVPLPLLCHTVSMSSNDDVLCARCDDLLPDDSHFMSCTECQSQYHLSDCSGVPARNFKAKRKSLINSWKCRGCKKGGASSSQKSKQTQEHSIAVILAGITAKLDTLMTLKETVESIEKSQQLISSSTTGL